MGLACSYSAAIGCMRCLAHGPCSKVGNPLLPQASRNLHLPTNLASSQRPRRALWSNPFSITKHSHPLHPKAKRDASQNRPQPSTTIKNYQANLFARDFAAPFVQPLAKSPPIWPASAFFPFRPPAFFLPLLLRIPPHRNRNRIRNRARTKHFDSHLLVASHRIARQTCTQRSLCNNSSTSPYTTSLSTRHGPFVHPSLDCTAPSWHFQFDAAQPGHALRPLSRRAPATSDSISYTSWSFVYLAVLVLIICHTLRVA